MTVSNLSTLGVYVGQAQWGINCPIEGSGFQGDVQLPHHPKAPALRKGFQVLYKLKFEEYSETPVYK